MPYTRLSEINENMTASSHAIADADHTFLQTIHLIASYIMEHAEEKPIIILSGPSGSGKTTTAFLIERYLDNWNMETHTISMDNFFRTMTPEEQELSARGEMDLESPERLDIPYLNQQLHSILKGEPTWIPRYHFSTTTRDDHDWLLTRKPNELVIVEGIHALNPKVIMLPDDATVRLYISVRTRVTQDDIVLHPSRLRLLRRMIRDQKFRKRELDETVSMFAHVQDGEDKYIAPYKKRASFSVDTFLPYELGVYKTILQDEVMTCASNEVLKELQAIWADIKPLPVNQVPSDSLIREFIGDSVFHY